MDDTLYSLVQAAYLIAGVLFILSLAGPVPSALREGRQHGRQDRHGPGARRDDHPVAAGVRSERRGHRRV